MSNKYNRRWFYKIYNTVQNSIFYCVKYSNKYL